MKKRITSVFLTLVMVFSLFAATLSTASAAYSVKVTTGKYYEIYNVGGKKYLNVYGNRNANNTNVTLWSYDGTSGEKYKFVKSGSTYVLVPQCASKRAVNVYGDYAKNGSNVCIWSQTGHSTQKWIVEYVAAKGGFIFRSANNKNYVLAAAGGKDGSNVYLKKYNPNDNYQIWRCDGLTAKSVSSGSSSSSSTASNLKISPIDYPTGSLAEGSYYNLTGTVTSKNNIKSVRGEIVNSKTGDVVFGKTVNPNSKNYSIGGNAIDKALKFNELDGGKYYLKYTAQDSSGKKVTWTSKTFTVVVHEKRITLYKPLKNMRVSRDAKILDIYTGNTRYHAGIDLEASIGTTVTAVADGVVTRVGYSGERGNYVVVYHKQLGIISVYQHLKKQAVSKGEKVTGGTTIVGYSGDTGFGTGPHLHMELVYAPYSERANVDYGWSLTASWSCSQMWRIYSYKEVKWIS